MIHQPDSELSLWYEKRFGKGSSRVRKIGIVALARKLPNVRAEMALTVLSYNIMRAIKILGAQRMIEALA